MKRLAYIIGSETINAGELTAIVSHSGFEAVVFDSVQTFTPVSHVLDCGVAIIELKSMDHSGIDLIAQLKAQRYLHVPIGCSADPSVRLAVDAMRAGALHYLPRPFKPIEICSALHEAYLALLQTTRDSTHKAAAAQQTQLLTVRQREILSGLMSGERNQAIAKRLGISCRTVESHRKKMMERLGADTIADAIRVGLDSGMNVRPRSQDQPLDATQAR